MSTRTKLLAVLSLPAGVIGYLVSAAVLQALGLGLADAFGGLLLLFVPLLVGALCMAPFLLPFFDQLARRDLKALQDQRAAEAPPRPRETEPPD